MWRRRLFACRTMKSQTCWRWPSRFFFKDTATTEIYTLSLHDALPIYLGVEPVHDGLGRACGHGREEPGIGREVDRKSTRLNSSHVRISYAVFFLQKQMTVDPGGSLFVSGCG